MKISRENEYQQSVPSWILGAVGFFALGSVFPLALTFAMRWAGWFYSDHDLNLFPSCVALSLLCGLVFAYKFGALQRARKDELTDARAEA